MKYGFQILLYLHHKILLHKIRDKKLTTSSLVHGPEKGNIADLRCTLVRE